MDFPSGGFWGPSVRALDHVDMEVDPGEIRGVVGESGSGKTTLARCLLRLIKPTFGSVYFDGQDLAALSPAALRAKRREFQMIFQDPYSSLNPAMTVEEILLEPFQIHRIGNPEERNGYVRELLDAVSLSAEWIKRKPAELSGGQQQRVGIARGLALKPRLVIADEPVSALDASVQAQILNLLADLTRRYALTLILISHSLYVVHYLCSRISVMLRGRIVEEAPAPVFFQEPRHPYSRLLLETMPAPGTAERDRRQLPAEDLAAFSKIESCCPFFPHCPRALPVCKEQPPPFREIAPGEKVRCFLY
jgi:oligopeptide/dipeptide ABC transporter ATP-binding protein